MTLNDLEGLRIELLADEYKKVNQAVIERNVLYISKYSSLQDVVGNWLEEEIAFLRTKQQLTMTFADSEKQMPMISKLLWICRSPSFPAWSGDSWKKSSSSRPTLQTGRVPFRCGCHQTVEKHLRGQFPQKVLQPRLEEGTKKSVIDMLNKVIDWLLRN